MALNWNLRPNDLSPDAEFSSFSFSSSFYQVTEEEFFVFYEESNGPDWPDESNGNNPRDVQQVDYDVEFLKIRAETAEMHAALLESRQKTLESRLRTLELFIHKEMDKKRSRRLRRRLLLK
jgi:hypothetical protein